MAEMVTIPKEEYERLKKAANRTFAEDVEEGLRDAAAGRFKEV